MKKFAAIVAALLLAGLNLPAQEQLLKSLAEFDYAGAIKAIDSLVAGEAVKDSTKVRNLMLTKVQCLKKLAKTEEAADVLVSMLPEGRFDGEVMNELADCHYSGGNIKESLDYYQILSLHYPDNIFYKIRLARLYFRQQDYGGCISAARAVTERDTIPAVILLLGDSFSKVELPDSALYWYSLLLRRNPANSAAVNRSSKIYLDRKQYDSAIELTDAYLGLVPDDRTILPVSGLAKYLKKDYQGSLQTFRHLRELGDNSYGTHLYTGLNYDMLGNSFDASEELSQAYAIDSSDVNLVISLAAAYSSHPSEKFMQESKRLYNRALSMMQPDSAMMYMVYQSYAASLYRMYDWDAAIEYYGKAYSYNGSFLSALSTIGYCYEQKKDYRKALEYYEKYKYVATPGTKAYEFVEGSIAYIKEKLFMEDVQ